MNIAKVLIVGGCVLFLFIVGWMVNAYYQLVIEGDRICEDRGYAGAVWIETDMWLTIEYVDCSPDPKPARPVRIQVNAS